MSHKLVIAALSAGLLCAQPLAAQAGAAEPMGMGQFVHHGMGGMRGSPFLMLLRSAELTPAQQSQVQLILNSNKAQMEALHAQLQSIHEQFAAKLLGQGSVSAADLKPLVEQASRAEAQLTENMANTAVAVRNVLTPEQVKKLAEVHRKLRSLHTQVRSLLGSGAGAPDTDD
ncbi:MAG TPA: periplasmic heavy metal sensor [Rhizomicrobium sp.]|nr:periplasmic heavy metal sensor [Rhizomicrobium sp.]